MTIYTLITTDTHGMTTSSEYDSWDYASHIASLMADEEVVTRITITDGINGWFVTQEGCIIKQPNGHIH